MRRIVIASLVGALAALLAVPSGINAAGQENNTVRITILYDNTSTDADSYSADWGFSALIALGDQVILFDTGAKGDLLLHNMTALGIDPASITHLVLSHEHSDHVGGLRALFAAGIAPEAAFVPPAFSQSIKNALATVTTVVEVEPGQEIVPGIRTTGELTTGIIPEQALLIDSADGLIVLTGCAHPGVVEIVRAAHELTDQPVTLVMGGFHLLELSTTQIAGVIRELHELDVIQAGPSHCTGEDAIRMFAQDYGENFVTLGVGTVLDFATTNESAG